MTAEFTAQAVPLFWPFISPRLNIDASDGARLLAWESNGCHYWQLSAAADGYRFAFSGVFSDTGQPVLKQGTDQRLALDQAHLTAQA